MSTIKQAMAAPDRANENLAQKIEMAGSFSHEDPVSSNSSAPSDEGHEELLAWSRIRLTFRDAFSEFFGTFIMLLFGDGVVAQVVLSEETKGNYQSISWGWG